MHRAIVLWLAPCAIGLASCLPSPGISAQVPSDTPAAVAPLQISMQVVGQSRCRLTDVLFFERFSVRVEVRNEGVTAVRVVPLDFLFGRIWSKERELTDRPDEVVSPDYWLDDDWEETQARIEIQAGESASFVLPLDVVVGRARRETGLVAGDHVGLVIVQLFVEADGAAGRWQRMEAPLNMRIPEPSPAEEMADC